MSENADNTIELKDVKRKMRFSGKVIKTTLGGAIVDIGLDKPGIVHISRLHKGPVKRVEDHVEVGKEVEVWVQQVNKKAGYVELTMVEPMLFDWGELKSGMQVKGEVVRLEKFGVFIEIGAERPGLAHISELTHDYVREAGDVVKVGESVDAQILDIDRKKKQIKLSLKSLTEDPNKVVVDDDEEEDEVEVPTAMEMAIRKAMDKNGGGQDRAEVSAADSDTEISASEREAILARTLENKVRTE